MRASGDEPEAFLHYRSARWTCRDVCSWLLCEKNGSDAGDGKFTDRQICVQDGKEVTVMPWNGMAYETDIYHIVQWFFIYSILGWCVESIYMSFCERKPMNRGFIFGPICPIYGFGALGAYFLLKPLENNYVLLYLFGSIGATFFEFLVAKLMIHIFGTVWWDYHEKPFNYQGIICLESTLAWGLYTICLFGFLHKGVMALANTYPYRIGCIGAGVLMLYYLIDFTIHLCIAKKDEMPEAVRGLLENFCH